MMDRTGQVQVLVTNFQNLKKGSNVFPSAGRGIVLHSSTLPSSCFAYPQFHPRQKRVQKQTGRPTQAHCLGAEASCASRMLFVAILRISSCQTWISRGMSWRVAATPCGCYACTYRWHPVADGGKGKMEGRARRKSTDFRVNRRNTASPTLNGCFRK